MCILVNFPTRVWRPGMVPPIIPLFRIDLVENHKIPVWGHGQSHGFQIIKFSIYRHLQINCEERSGTLTRRRREEIGGMHPSVSVGTRVQSSSFVFFWCPVCSHRRSSSSRPFGSRLRRESGIWVQRVDVRHSRLPQRRRQSYAVCLGWRKILIQFIACLS